MRKFVVIQFSATFWFSPPTATMTDGRADETDHKNSLHKSKWKINKLPKFFKISPIDCVAMDERAIPYASTHFNAFVIKGNPSGKKYKLI